MSVQRNYHQSAARQKRTASVLSPSNSSCVATRLRGRAPMIFVVTYDLRSGRDRTSLFKTLQSFGRCCQFMASGWVISTSSTPANLAAGLLPYLDPQDSICIMPLVDTHAAYLPKRAANWVAAQQPLTRERARRVRVLQQPRRPSDLDIVASMAD
jgi:hypothetical protein